MGKRAALVAILIPSLVLSLSPAVPATAQVTPTADLAITKTDSTSYYAAGASTTYVITVTNNGPDGVTGAVVTDTLPALVGTASWTAVFTSGSGTASGTGSINQTIDLSANGTAVYTLTADIGTTATGNLVNTATVAAPAGVTDPNAANNTSTDTDSPSVDLQVTNRDFNPTYTPGLASIYTLTVTNASNEPVTGAYVENDFPEQVSTVTWEAVFTGTGSSGTASGSGDIGEYINLAAGGTAVYTVTANTSSTATGNLINSATVTEPPGVNDSSAFNNFWIDIDIPLRVSGLAITKTDGTTTFVPGSSAVYTVVVTNQGPSFVTGARVVDTFPAYFTSVAWTALFEGVGSTGAVSGTGNIDETVSLSAEGTATYTITAQVAPTVTADLVNTATVSVPPGTIDVNPLDNSATDTDSVTPQVDLAITKSDGVATYVPGQTTQYTITVANSGPSILTGGTLIDTLPAGVTGATWTASYTGTGSSGATSGAGNLSTAISLGVGGTATFVVRAPVSAAATGDLVNTATIAVPAGTTNLNPATSATDTDTQDSVADVRIYKTDGSSRYQPGSTATYTITVANFGPSDVTGARVVDTLPVLVGSATWTAVFSNGSGTASGTGNIDQLINLAAGGTATYTVVAPIVPSASGELVNTATVTLPVGVTDPDPANNTSTDVDTTAQVEPSVAVYRFYNYTTRTHFYTASISERDFVITGWSDIYRYEGVAYHSPSGAGVVPLYRFYNMHTDTHFYTASDEEKAHVIATLAGVMRYEGITYGVLMAPAPGCVPVHRFFNRLTGAHFYTASDSERLAVQASYAFFRYEGVAFYVMP